MIPTEAVEFQTQPVIYPESDGKPMAETDIHRQEMMDIIATLSEYFRERTDVYVAGNLLLYYKEGHPQKSVAPDVFVVFGIERKLRRTYKLWEERVAPQVVFEISSASTCQEDLEDKRTLYAQLGVAEYFLYDPLAEYLQPPLQGLRLHKSMYVPIPPEADGSLTSQVLGMRVTIEADRLRLVDATSGARLLRPDEVAEARRLAEQQAQAEAEARRLAEQQAQAEAEARRLAEQQAQVEQQARQVAEQQAQAEAEARRLAEQQAQAEAEARRLAEQRMLAAEAEIARLRAQLAQVQPPTDVQDNP